jgi:hypothetical protein
VVDLDAALGEEESQVYESVIYLSMQIYRRTITEVNGSNDWSVSDRTCHAGGF